MSKPLKKERRGKEKITIVLPPTASSDIDMDLVKLTKYLTKKVFKGEWQGGGLLGGEFGYGVEYENDIFMMHPYCWCEEDECLWCEKNWPNFIFKPNNTRIWWYKWIGRDMERKGILPFNWLDICKKSIK